MIPIQESSVPTAPRPTAQSKAKQYLERYQAGEQLSLRELAYVARYYPEEITRPQRQEQQTQLRQAQKFRQLEFVVSGAEVPPEVLQLREYEKYKYQTRVSTEFYTELGYPSFAGKYLPFETPEGLQVAGIKETKQGLQVTYEEKAPKGIAETIIGIKLPKLVDLQPWYMKTVKREAHPERFIAGMIASVEAPVYSIARIAGVKTPRVPPVVISGVVGEALERAPWIPIIGGKETTELERAVGYGPEYAAGTIFGDIYAGIGITKGLEKTVVKHIVKPRATEWLTQRWRAGGLTWKGWKEKLVMKVTGARPHLPYGEVSIPAVEYVTAKGAVRPELSTAALQAEQLAWEMTIAPRTAGVMITKWPTQILTKAKLPVFFGLGKELIPAEKIYGEALGFKKGEEAVRPLKWKKAEPVGSFQKIKYTMPFEGEYYFIKGYYPPPARELEKLLPFVTQAHVTRMGVHPYVPRVPYAGGKVATLVSDVSMAMGTVAVSLPARPERLRKETVLEITPKVSLPEEYREVSLKRLPLFVPEPKAEKPKLAPVLKFAPKPRERTFPRITPDLAIFPKEAQIPTPRVEAVTKPVVAQVPKIKLVEMPTMDFPTPTIPKTPPTTTTPPPTPPFIIPKFPEAMRGRGPKGWGERWFKREHAILTPKELRQKLTIPLFEKKKKRKRKKKDWMPTFQF